MKNFIPPYQLAQVDPHTSVLLALSGGADSRLLLHLLAEDAATTGYPLHVAHVNHGIRGEEADRDEAFCRALAEQYQCPFHILHTNIPALAQARKESVELTARDVRYAYFKELMQEYHLPLLATAHHADDNMETVLLRLARGTSAKGLSGIAPCRPFGEGYLTRPLLSMTRRQIENDCHRMGLTYVTDHTNSDTTYARNLVRASITPVMERLTQHPQKQVLRTCRSLREDDAYLTEIAANAWNACKTSPETIPIETLRAQPPPIRKRMLLLFLREQQISSPEGCHLDALLHLIETSHGGQCDLPGAVRAISDGITLTVQSKELSPPLPFAPIPFEVGCHDYPEAGFRTTMQPVASQNFDKKQNVYNPFIHDAITFDTIDVSAHWRMRKEGDMLLMGGMHRRVRKLQNACGIPPSLREQLPLLCDKVGILYVPFVGVRDHSTCSRDMQHPRAMHLCFTVLSTSLHSPCNEKTVETSEE